MAEPTKQERYTKLMEALEALDELELGVRCFGPQQVETENIISNYCRDFKLADVDLKDEEIQCKEDFALFIAHKCFWHFIRNLSFGLDNLEFKALLAVVDHLKVLLQPPVADWHRSKTLFALVTTFRQMVEQSVIVSFYAYNCSKDPIRCGEVAQVTLSQTGISFARNMQENVIQVAKMAVRTQQFKTIKNDLSVAVKRFMYEVAFWFQNAREADEEALEYSKYIEDIRGKEMICSGCWTGWKGCQRTLLLLCQLDHRHFDFDRFFRHFSEYAAKSQNLRKATSKLLDLSLPSELQNSDPQPDISATSLNSWTMVDVADQEKPLEVDVASIASYTSVDSQTSCLSGSGGPHCFLPTCRFKCVEDETSLVREVLGKDTKLLKHVSLVTKIHL